MPSQIEQIAQIETALRQRFFSLVPKVIRAGRESWNEDCHDTDRLSRALAAYAIGGLAKVPDDIAAGTIVDGPDDFGIDAIYYDRINSRLLIVQSKFKRSGASPTEEETLKVINGTRKLINKNLAGFNQNFQSKFDEIEEAIDTPGVTINLVLAFLGETIGPHAIHDLDNFRNELNGSFQTIIWEPYSCSSIYKKLCDEQAALPVSVTISLSNAVCIKTPRKAIYGQIDAAALAKLVSQNGAKIFQRNIRNYLGSVAVNTSIQESVRRKPGDFFYLNNGITALASEILSSGRGTTFTLKGFSIVNGAQTAGSIATAATAKEISPDAKVLITVIEIGQNPDDIGTLITKARNYQNVVKGIDFAALDPQQERLRKELASIGIKYHYRPSAEAKISSADSINVEDAALAIACLSAHLLTSREIGEMGTRGQKIENGVDYVVMSKKEISRLWEPEGSVYTKLFCDTLSGVRVCRLVRIYRRVDTILADTEAAEWNRYDRRMFFRHGRYFIMSVLVHHCPKIVESTNPNLSEADNLLISQMVNELAELIFAETQRLQFGKGYLSIFRNLGDAQDLADGVLTKLPASNTLPSQVASS